MQCDAEQRQQLRGSSHVRSGFGRSPGRNADRDVRHIGRKSSPGAPQRHRAERFRNSHQSGANGIRAADNRPNQHSADCDGIEHQQCCCKWSHVLRVTAIQSGSEHMQFHPRCRWKLLNRSGVYAHCERNGHRGTHCRFVFVRHCRDFGFERNRRCSRFAPIAAGIPHLSCDQRRKYQRSANGNPYEQWPGHTGRTHPFCSNWISDFGDNLYLFACCWHQLHHASHLRSFERGSAIRQSYDLQFEPGCNHAIAYIRDGVRFHGCGDGSVEPDNFKRTDGQLHHQSWTDKRVKRHLHICLRFTAVQLILQLQSNQRHRLGERHRQCDCTDRDRPIFNFGEDGWSLYRETLTSRSRCMCPSVSAIGISAQITWHALDDIVIAGSVRDYKLRGRWWRRRRSATSPQQHSAGNVFGCRNSNIQWDLT